MAWVRCTNVTDRQTDRRQTDGWTTTYSERQDEITFTKKRKLSGFFLEPSNYYVVNQKPTFTYAICHRQSVCHSVCRLSVNKRRGDEERRSMAKFMLESSWIQRAKSKLGYFLRYLVSRLCHFYTQPLFCFLVTLPVRCWMQYH